MGSMIRRRGIDGAARRCQCAPHRVRLKVEPVRVFLAVEQREQGPAVAAIRRLPHCELQRATRGQVLPRVETLEVREAAQHRLVRSQVGRILAAQGLRHAVRQNTVSIGNRADDSRRQIVNDFELTLRVQLTFINLGPQICA